MPTEDKPRGGPPRGEAGREYVTPALRARKLYVTERYLRARLASFPPFTDEQRRTLANLIAPEGESVR